MSVASRWTRAAAVVVGYTLLTVFAVEPLIDFRHLTTASYEGDARLLIWTLAWDAHALLTGTRLFDANIFFPAPRALSYAEHHIGIGLFAAPLQAAAANPVLTYWILWLLAFPLNALAMHALALRVTHDRMAAFAAGCIYAFCFFRMHHAHGHIQLLWTWMFPLVPLALDDWLRRPTAGRAAAALALVLLAALTSWYLAVFVVVLVLSCVACLVPGRRIERAHLRQGALAGLVGFAVVLWFARPYLDLAPGPLTEAAGNSADWRSYLVPPTNTWFGQLLSQHTEVGTRWIWGEQTLYVGVSVLLMAAAGIRSVFLRFGDENGTPISVAVLIAGGVALALSFGPSSTGLSPFDLMARVPGLELVRAPARFALLVMLAGALLAAYGVSWIRQRFTRRGAVVVGALLFLFFVESRVVAFPAGKPTPVSVPRVYTILADRPPGAVLSLPTYRATPEAFRESDYLLFSTVHWHPIVNGFGRQEPRAHGGRMTRLAGFPAPDALALMRELGIRYVVMHTARASHLATRLEAARAAAKLLYGENGEYLFELQ